MSLMSTTLNSGDVILPGATIPTGVKLPNTVVDTQGGTIAPGEPLPAPVAVPATAITLTAAATVPLDLISASKVLALVTPSASSLAATCPSAATSTVTASLQSAQNSTYQRPASAKQSHCPNRNGAIAGAAVGAGVGAALVAVVLTWLICGFLSSRRRRATAPSARRDSSGDYQYHSKPDTAMKMNNLSAPGPTVAVGGLQEHCMWQYHLPHPADDATVRSWVKTIFDQVELHVENFYQNAATHETKSIESGVSHVESPYLPQSITTLLAHSKEPMQLIKHCVLWSIVSGISPEFAGHRTLLPDEFVAFPGPQLDADPAFTKQQAIFDQAMCQWRVLTAYLRARSSSDDKYVSERDDTIQRSVSDILTVFAPFVNKRMANSERTRNLTSIFTSASQKGVQLFSQPCGFRFDWTAAKDGRSRDVVVITPAFVKVQDEHGQRLRPAQVLINSTRSRL